MASADWTFFTNVLDNTNVERGVTAGTPIGVPAGGGTFTFGFNSLTAVVGGVGLFTNQVSFAPAAKGGSIRGAIVRAASGGNTKWSSFLFIGVADTDFTIATGYKLGLNDDDPSKITLSKGLLTDGLPAGTPDPTVNTILRQSSGTTAIDTYRHLRLDMVANDTGDVVLKVFENDLSVNDVDAPVWQVVPGMTDFIDDALGVATGSLPFTSGRMGFAFVTSDVTRRSFFDQVEAFRQT